MKKILLFSCGVLIATANADAQTAVRNGFVEEFSSSTCGPCKAVFDEFHGALEAKMANDGQSHIFQIQYGMNWPNPNPASWPKDPSYNADGAARRTHYGVNGVPFLLVNGVEKPILSQTQAQLETSIEGSKTGTADFEITGTYKIKQLTATTGEQKMTVNVKPLKTLSGNYTVHVALTQNHYFFDSSTVAMTDYHNIVRKMFPDGTGVVEASWTANTAKTYNYNNNYTVVGPRPAHPAINSFDFWESAYETKMFVWVEDASTKEVLQSGMVPAAWETSVEDVNQVANVAVYPNPAADDIKVRFTLDKPATVQIAMIDMTGRTVYTIGDQKLNSGYHGYTIPTANIASGIYNVIISNGNSVKTEKISVEK